MPFAQPAARAGTGRRGVIAAGHRAERLALGARASCRAQAAARCAHRAAPKPPTANAVPHVLPARLPERTFLLATPARGARARLLPRLLIADPAPQYAVAVRFRPGNFKSFNSLSRVLFIFRSRYLFAIGLGRAILQLRKPWLGSLSAVFTLHS